MDLRESHPGLCRYLLQREARGGLVVGDPLCSDGTGYDSVIPDCLAVNSQGPFAVLTADDESCFFYQVLIGSRATLPQLPVVGYLNRQILNPNLGGWDSRLQSRRLGNRVNRNFRRPA